MKFRHWESAPADPRGRLIPGIQAAHDMLVARADAIVELLKRPCTERRMERLYHEYDAHHTAAAYLDKKIKEIINARS